MVDAHHTVTMPSSTRVSEPDASVLDLRLVPWRDWNEWYKVKVNYSQRRDHQLLRRVVSYAQAFVRNMD